LAQAAHDAAHDAGKLALGAKDAVGQAAARGINQARQGAHLIPGVTPLKSYADQHAERVEAAAIDRQTELRKRAATELSAARAEARSTTRRWNMSWLFGRRSDPMSPAVK
jgi:hypothetical protein